MGDIADSMIDGLMCQSCGEYIDGDEPGYARFCAGCQSAELDQNHRPPPSNPVRGGTRPAPPKQWKYVTVPGYIKVNCPECNAKVKAVGLDEHMRAKHSASASS